MITVLVAGDICPKDRLKKRFSDRDFNFVFGLIKPYFKGCDVSIGNFECALADSQDIPIVKCGPNLSCDENFVDALRWMGFNVLTLANNHFADYGASSMQKSISAMTSRGILHVGAGMDLKTAQKSLVIDVKEKRIGIINCCEHEFSIATDDFAGCNPLDPVEQCKEIQRLRSSVDFILVIVHGGTEFCQLPSPRMKKLYRFFVDQGADVVINHHQHCFSGYEQYKGKHILYGIGNFCFDWDGKRKSSWNEGYLAQIIFNDDGCQKFDMIPYKQCDEEARVTPIVSEKEIKEFYDEVYKLNAIIADDKKMNTDYYSWIDSHERNTKMTLSVYSTRFFRALCNRGFLPSFITKKRMVLLYNHVNCESHRDRILHYIEKRI